jgi:hypothetical protein
MNRFAALLICFGAALVVPAAADNLIEPGQWKITSNTQMNGATIPPQMKSRCLTPEQAADIDKTFGPSMGTINSTCERTEHEATGRTLKWRMQCKGQLDMDVSGNFNFDTPTHYTGTIASKAWMAGALMNDAKTEVEGERVSDCPQ